MLMPQRVDILPPPAPLRSALDQQTGAMVSGKRQRNISIVHSGPVVVLNAVARKYRGTDGQCRYRPRRLVHGVATSLPRLANDLALGRDHAPQHAPLRARLWFRPFDANADFRAGMRPTQRVVDGAQEYRLSERICAGAIDGRCVP